MESSRNIMLKLSSNDLALLIAGSQDLPSSAGSHSSSSNGGHLRASITSSVTVKHPSHHEEHQQLQHQQQHGLQHQQQDLLHSIDHSYTPPPPPLSQHHLFSSPSGDDSELSGSSVVWSNKHAGNWSTKHGAHPETRWTQRVSTQSPSPTVSQMQYSSSSLSQGIQSKSSGSRSFPVQFVQVDGAPISQGQAKSKIIPIFVSGDKLIQVQTSSAPSHLQNTTTSNSDLPVDLRNVVILPRGNSTVLTGVSSQGNPRLISQTLNQGSNNQILSQASLGNLNQEKAESRKFQFSFPTQNDINQNLGVRIFQETHSHESDLNEQSGITHQKQTHINSSSLASPVYKSKLEKAIAQNQHSAQNQTSTTKSSPSTSFSAQLKHKPPTGNLGGKIENISSGTLKRLLCSTDDDYLQQLQQQQQQQLTLSSPIQRQSEQSSEVKSSLTQQQSTNLLMGTHLYSSHDASIYPTSTLTSNDTMTASAALLPSDFNIKTSPRQIQQSDVPTINISTNSSLYSQTPAISSNSSSYSQTPAVNISSAYSQFQHSTLSGTSAAYQIATSYQQRSSSSLTSTSPTPSSSISALPASFGPLPSVTPTHSLQPQMPSPSTLMPPPSPVVLSSSTGSVLMEESIEEKDYMDDILGRQILEGMWKLREMDMFCDTVLLVEQTEIKLHRLVLSAICYEVTKMVMKSSEPTLTLLLPLDITYSNAMVFVSYVYHGKVTLNLDNVQQVYRLSGMFGMGQLSKHCYDFCKLAKCGHLIISSPYQEALVQVSPYPSPQKVPQSQENAVPENQCQKTASKDKTIPTNNVTIQHEPVPDISVQSDAKGGQSKINDEFDWLTSDPSQSNIPIRKRGRNRKSIITAARCEVNKTIVESKSPVEETVKVRGTSTESEPKAAPKTRVKEMVEGSINMTPKSTRVKEGVEGSIRNEKSEMSDLESSSGVLVIDDRDEEERTIVKPAEDIAVALASLPDPLVSGKIDESELLKLAQIDLETADKPVQLARLPQPPVKTMVTRFRARPNNMTVMEAAAHNKAKFYDISAPVSQKKERKGRNARSAKQTKLTQSTSKDVIQQSEIKHRKHVEDTNVTKVTKNDASEFQLIDVENEVPMDVQTVEDVPVVMDEVSKTVLKNLLVEKQATVEPAEEGQEMEEEGDIGGDGPKSKRLRLRKTGGEESPLKENTVYMRPPPKKRTKEIHEMMKHEQDISQADTVSSFKLELLMSYADDQYKEIVQETNNQEAPDNKPQAVQKKKRIRKPNNDGSLVTQKVCEIEQQGKSIEGDKQYRCLFCSNVFAFAKRAVTHILNTHDVDIDEINDSVFVESRSTEPIVCEICGYESKEGSKYYVHFHKYFKHGVPLPKGWAPFTCDLCKKEFFTKFQLRDHKLLHFEEHPFMCEICGSGFRTRPCLNSHVFHKHSLVRRHKCTECPKTFKTRTQMKVHQRIHTGEKPFLCVVKECNYRSTTRGNMRLHLVNRHKYSAESVKDIMQNLQPDDTLVEESPEMESPNSKKDEEISNLNENLALHLNKEQIAENLHAEQEGGTFVGLETGYSSAAANMADQLVSAQESALGHGGFGMATHNILISQSDKDHSKRQNHSDIGHDISDNIPRHVQLLITNSNTISETHHLLPDEAEHILAHEFEPHSHSVLQEQQQQQFHSPSSESSVTIHRDFVPTVFDNQGTLGRFSHQTSGTKPKPIDPQSREARSLVKAVFLKSSHPRSLLKNVLMDSNNQNFALHDARSSMESHGHITDKDDASGRGTVMDMQRDMVQSQHNMAGNHEQADDQFRDGVTVMYNNNGGGDGGGQREFNAHLNQVVMAHSDQSFNHDSMPPPPSYSSAAQSNHQAVSLSSFNAMPINMNQIELVSDHLASTEHGNPDHGQEHSDFHGNDGEQSMEVQGQIVSSRALMESGSSGYQSSGTPSLSTGQFSAVAVDGNMYQAYYDDQYEIENY